MLSDCGGSFPPVGMEEVQHLQVVSPGLMLKDTDPLVLCLAFPSRSSVYIVVTARDRQPNQNTFTAAKMCYTTHVLLLEPEAPRMTHKTVSPDKHWVFTPVANKQYILFTSSKESHKIPVE